MEEKKTLSIDRAAFLLLRVKKAFKRKKSQRKDKEKGDRNFKALTSKKPLLRSRTMPAIVRPQVDIIRTQIGFKCCDAHSVPKSKCFKSSINLQVPSHCCWHREKTASNSNENVYDFRRKSTMTNMAAKEIMINVDGNRNPCFTFNVEGDKSNAMPITIPPHKSFNRSCALSNCSNQGCPNSFQFYDEIFQLKSASLDRKKNIKPKLQRSISTNSMMELVSENDNFNDRKHSSSSNSTFRPYDQKSPISNRKLKLHRNQNELLIRNEDCESSTVAASSTPLPLMEIVEFPSNSLANSDWKTGKKKSKPTFLFKQSDNKGAQFEPEFQAQIISAVEHGNLEKARNIFESADVDINSITSEGLSLVSVAVLSNNKQMTRMLLDFGSRENNLFSNFESLRLYLEQLQRDFQLKIHELGGSSNLHLDSSKTSSGRSSISSIISGSYSSSISGCAGGDIDKQIFAWARRLKFIQCLNLGVSQLKVPNQPSSVQIEVLSRTNVSVRIHEPMDQEMAIVTKFRVEWSTRSDFNLIVGQCEIIDSFHNLELTHGRRYYFRVACGNLKGFGDYCYSTPDSIIPSSWNDIQNQPGRFDGKMDQLDVLVQEVKQFRPYCDIFDCQNLQKAKLQKKKTAIKQLFTVASKFQKNLRRGVYLATIFYHDDKVLVTGEDFLPVLEVDEIYPGSVNTDLHWLMKVSCFWEDIKSLKADMEKNSTSTLHHFRSKVLATIIQMQSALNALDLGTFFHKPLKDSQGTMVFTTINHIQSPKSILVLNSRWLHLSKLQKKYMLTDDNCNVGDILIASVSEQIRYHAASQLKVSRGLYAAYLKLQSSIDMLHVIVPCGTPNILPHCKVRDNPHVTAEEWSQLRNPSNLTSTDQEYLLEKQTDFRKSLMSAIKCLLKYMDVAKTDYAAHRIFDVEIIELNSDISLIVVCPSTEHSCSISGQREFLFQRNDLLSIPIQVFEMIHLNTYKSSVINKYARLSCLLELDQVAANHSHREAFSTTELAATKERLTILRSLHSRLTLVWKSVRWLIDIITFVRDKGASGISLQVFLDDDKNSNENIDHLKLPPRDFNMSKTSNGRGSWPGPSHTVITNNALIGELSKSEQLLSLRKDSSSQSLNREMKGININSKMAAYLPSSTKEYNVLRPIKSSTSLKTYTLETNILNTLASRSLSSIQTVLEDNEGFKVPKIDVLKMPANNKHFSGILQVFAAYETGMAIGTCLKLHVTSKTTAKEVVDIVVRQLNRTVQLKGKKEPFYDDDCLKDFCLVAIIGARERCLRDDFFPLMLQNPWKKGRLFVRKRDAVLAALECETRMKSTLV